MVKGLDTFRTRFAPFEGAFILIGGAACDTWFADQGLAFRATKDLDIVLVVEVLDARLVAAIRAFVAEGGYRIQERSEAGKSPVLYRFGKPTNPNFPAMLEFFSRALDDLELADAQSVIPISTGPEKHSLSAILLDQAYYDLIRTQKLSVSGLDFATVTALIPLKARAWIDLSSRRAAGEKIDGKDIEKHRSDVFRLAATLPGTPGPRLPAGILDDLGSFLDAFPETSPEWPAITAALRAMGLNLSPGELRAALRTYFFTRE